MEEEFSQNEAYKVAHWLKKKGIKAGAALVYIWRNTPSQVAEEYGVDEKDLLKAAGRKYLEYKGDVK